MQLIQSVALATFGFFFCAQVVGAASYNYAVLDIPDGDTDIRDINNLGQVVGTLFLSVVGRTGFVYDHGSYQSNSPALPGNEFFGNNDVGQIVGFSLDPFTSLQKGFVDSNGVFSSINVPGSSATIPYAINNAGEIVGSYQLPGQNNPNYGFTLSPTGVYTTVSFPGGLSTSLTGINDLGQIVGEYSDATGPHNFLYRNGQFTPGGGYSINNLGQTTIQSSVMNPEGGVLNPDGTVVPIFVPGYVITTPLGINDAGQVVGQVLASHGVSASFVATPTTVPEPGTLSLTALIGSALLMLARAAKAREIRKN